MARVKLSSLFTSILGRYGGGVFRNFKGLTVLSALPSAVANPSTADQQKARGILACASKGFRGLDAATRSAWRAVATALSAQWQNSENEIGERQVIYPPRGPFTPLGALVSVCGLLGSVDSWECGDAFPTAPLGIGAPSIPLLGVLGGDTTAGLTVAFDDPSTWGAEATAGKVRVFVKSEDGDFHAQLAAVVTAAVETATVSTLKPRGGGVAVPIKKGVYHVQIDAVNAEGLRSAPSAVGEFFLDDPAAP